MLSVFLTTVVVVVPFLFTVVVVLVVVDDLDAVNLFAFSLICFWVSGAFAVVNLVVTLVRVVVVPVGADFGLVEDGNVVEVDFITEVLLAVVL